MKQILTETIDNGTISEVHIAPIGEFYGSDKDGNPIPENMTADALQALADRLNSSGDEILCDIDHSSVRAGAVKDSRAAGWFSKFILDPIKGLFATLTLTKKGKELLENREYRYVSPTFMLDDNGMPMDLHSIALTNVPAFRGFIRPIINSESEAKPISKITEDICNMSKEELIELVKNTVAECVKNSCCETKNECCEENEVVKNEAPNVDEETKVEETKVEDEVCENTDKKKEEPKVEETKVEEPKVEEPKVEEPKVQEVIKIEALNSAPTPTLNSEPEWKKLSGQAFFDWCDKHPNGI